jgi:hypothetical protein
MATTTTSDRVWRNSASSAQSDCNVKRQQDDQPVLLPDPPQQVIRCLGCESRLAQRRHHAMAVDRKRVRHGDANWHPRILPGQTAASRRHHPRFRSPRPSIGCWEMSRGRAEWTAAFHFNWQAHAGASAPVSVQPVIDPQTISPYRRVRTIWRHRRHCRVGSSKFRTDLPISACASRSPKQAGRRYGERTRQARKTPIEPPIVPIPRPRPRPRPKPKSPSGSVKRR